jgi:hypothetical protein
MATRKAKEIPIKPTEQTDICKNCRVSHFSRRDGLKCRRFPPVFVYDPATGASSAQWPEVDADGWCGEFRPNLSA